jgi:hypothetical protein
LIDTCINPFALIAVKIIGAICCRSTTATRDSFIAYSHTLTLIARIVTGAIDPVIAGIIIINLHTATVTGRAHSGSANISVITVTVIRNMENFTFVIIANIVSAINPVVNLGGLTQKTPSKGMTLFGAITEQIIITFVGLICDFAYIRNFPHCFRIRIYLTRLIGTFIFIITIRIRIAFGFNKEKQPIIQSAAVKLSFIFYKQSPFTFHLLIFKYVKSSGTVNLIEFGCASENPDFSFGASSAKIMQGNFVVSPF